MTILELQDKHLVIKDTNYIRCEDDHANISIQFAIEELSNAWNDNTEYGRIHLLERIKELKKYLDEH